MIGMIMFFLVGLTFTSAVRTLKVSYPDEQTPIMQNCPQQLTYRAHYLAQRRAEIESMPAGYEKIKAKELWLLELDNLLSNKATSSSQDNIIQFNHYQRH